MSTSPSNNTYIVSPFSPSRNRKSPGASCTVLLSCRKSSAGFMGQNQLLAAIERSATTAKLQLCDRRRRHLRSKFLSFACFVVNSLCHSERLPRRSLAKAGSRLPRHSFMRRLGGISQHLFDYLSFRAKSRNL